MAPKGPAPGKAPWGPGKRLAKVCGGPEGWRCKYCLHLHRCGLLQTSHNTDGTQLLAYLAAEAFAVYATTRADSFSSCRFALYRTDC